MVDRTQGIHSDVGEINSGAAKALIFVLAVIAVASIGWQAISLLDGGISEPVSIADLTGYANTGLTGIPTFDHILWQVMSLHIGLVSLIGICLVVVIDRLCNRS